MTTWQRICASCCSLGFAIACGTASSDAPAPPRAQTMLATGGWARGADSGAASAVYFMLENVDSTADTLRGARSDVAEEASLHVSTQAGSQMHMIPLVTLPVPALDSVSFRPLGAHVMLTRLIRPLADGDTIVLTLEFVSGNTLEVRAGVRVP